MLVYFFYGHNAKMNKTAETLGGDVDIGVHSELVPSLLGRCK